MNAAPLISFPWYWGLGGLLLLLALPTFAGPPTPTVGRYAKFEASFTLPNQAGNPFDPADNDVMVAFHQPSGSLVHVPAFWDGDVWKVRFAPTQEGLYTLTITRNDQPVQPHGVSADAFRCIASKLPGFIRRDPAHVQRFLFDHGRAYYPIGLDQAWSSQGLPDYPKMFALMHENDLNWAWVWMTHWDNKNLEWAADKSRNPKPGEYFLTAAQRWDALMDAAADSGIYVQMCLQHHGQYTSLTDPNWNDNPFNAANGGFLQKPEDFFTDPQAIRLTKAKYRYIVARWGYSPHLLSFELFNEVQNIGETRGRFGDVVNWHKTMAAYIRSLDVNHHLITTSNSPGNDPLAKIGLDYNQIHAYVPDMISFAGSLDVTSLTAPAFLGEWGASGQQDEAFLHDGLWANAMIPTAGEAQFWYWDEVAKKNWWPQFHSLARFVTASGLDQQSELKAVHASVLTTGRRSDISFAAPRGWEAATSANVTVSPSGQLVGLDGMSSFIQGQYHRDMTPQPIPFHLDCAAPCQFLIIVDTVAKAGAHPQLHVDGKLVTEKDYAAGEQDRHVGETLRVDVPAGLHTVTLFNTGNDWFTVQRITVTDYAPALAVLAKGNTLFVYFWAYTRNRTSAEPITGTIILQGPADSLYTLHLWDTRTGMILGTPTTVRSTGRQIKITLPSFTKDMAGYATQQH